MIYPQLLSTWVCIHAQSSAPPNTENSQSFLFPQIQHPWYELQTSHALLSQRLTSGRQAPAELHASLRCYAWLLWCTLQPLKFSALETGVFFTLHALLSIFLPQRSAPSFAQSSVNNDASPTSIPTFTSNPTLSNSHTRNKEQELQCCSAVLQSLARHSWSLQPQHRGRCGREGGPCAHR